MRLLCLSALLFSVIYAKNAHSVAHDLGSVPHLSQHPVKQYFPFYGVSEAPPPPSPPQPLRRSLSPPPLSRPTSGSGFITAREQNIVQPEAAPLEDPYAIKNVLSQALGKRRADISDSDDDNDGGDDDDW